MVMSTKQNTTESVLYYSTDVEHPNKLESRYPVSYLETPRKYGEILISVGVIFLGVYRAPKKFPRFRQADIIYIYNTQAARIVQIHMIKT